MPSWLRGLGLGVRDRVSACYRRAYPGIYAIALFGPPSASRVPQHRTHTGARARALGSALSLDRRSDYDTSGRVCHRGCVGPHAEASPHAYSRRASAPLADAVGAPVLPAPHRAPAPLAGRRMQR